MASTTKKTAAKKTAATSKTATASKKTATAKKATTAKTTPRTSVDLVNDGKAAGSGKGGTVTQHGVTTTGYQRGCRCDECRAAMNAYTVARREAKAAEAKAAEAAAKKAEKAAAKAATTDAAAAA